MSTITVPPSTEQASPASPEQSGWRVTAAARALWESPGSVVADALAGLPGVCAVFEAGDHARCVVVVVLDAEDAETRASIAAAKSAAIARFPKRDIEFDVTGPVPGRDDELLVEHLLESAEPRYLRSA